MSQFCLCHKRNEFAISMPSFQCNIIICQYATFPWKYRTHGSVTNTPALHLERPTCCEIGYPDQCFFHDFPQSLKTDLGRAYF